jgi:hypothetical protein
MVVKKLKISEELFHKNPTFLPPRMDLRKRKVLDDIDIKNKDLEEVDKDLEEVDKDLEKSKKILI